MINRHFWFCSFVFLAISAFSGQPVCSQPTVTLKPGDDINKSVKAYPPGTTFMLTAGEYRMQDVTPKSNMKFIGEKGAILNGSRLLTEWKKEGRYWVHEGQNQKGQRFQACVDGYTGCKYPEDLYKNDYPLRQDTTLNGLEPGEWYFDYNAQKVYMYDDPTGHKMEIGVSRRAFGGPASDVTIRGLIIEKYAIPGHMAVVGDQRPGDNWIVENNEIRLNHGQGIRFRGKAVIRGNYIHHNGQMGLTGVGRGGLVENNEIAYNTLKEIGFKWQAEGGGTKFSYTDSLIIRNNYVHHNEGPGLWTDMRNVNTLIEGNICVDNLASGIFHEISNDVIIRGNTLSGNARVHGAQIFISTSENAEIYENQVTVTKTSGDAIMVFQGKRELDGAPIYAVNNHVHHNDITYLVNARFSGANASYQPEEFWQKGNNRFDHNRYHLADANARRWRWNGQDQSWSGFRASGQEANGTIDTKVQPPRPVNFSAN